jgi:hypothetical protein
MHLRTTVVASVLLVGVAAGAQTQGIQPLTPATATEAIADGLLGSSTISNSPVAMRQRAVGRQLSTMVEADPRAAPVGCPHIPCAPVLTGRDLLMARAALERQLWDRPPFPFTIVTPYYIVSAIARDAARTSTTPTYPALDTLNAGRVAIHVAASDHLGDDVIANVIIRRDGQTLKPLKASVTPERLTNGFGATWASASGVFVFDFATFAPDLPIVIVLIGRTKNYEWTMSPDELGQLK